MGVLTGSLIKSVKPINDKPAMIIAPTTGTILHVSEEGSRFLRLTSFELEGRDIRDFLPVQLPPGPGSVPEIHPRIGNDGTWIDRTLMRGPDGVDEWTLTWQPVPMGWLNYWLLTIDQDNAPSVDFLVGEGSSLSDPPLKPAFHLVEHRTPDDGLWKFLSFHRPLGARGGDVLFIDELDRNHLFYFLGDVAGHHRGAVLVRMMLAMYLRIYREEYNPGNPQEFPGTLLGRLNHALAQDSGNDSLLTAVAIVLEKDGRALHYSSAGHPPLFLDREDGSRIELPSTDIPLGIRPRRKFQSISMRCHPGDQLLCYTDGLITSGHSSSFSSGVQSILETIEAGRGASPTELAGRIRALLAASSGAMNLYQDDVTFSVIALAPDTQGRENALSPLA
jgi:hypothetical protein